MHEDNKASPAPKTEGQACTTFSPSEYYYPPSIIERVQKNYAYCQEMAEKRVELDQLESLLKKNPDIARILDLLEKHKV